MVDNDEGELILLSSIVRHGMVDDDIENENRICEAIYLESGT
jgi:hypothetical protein